LSEKEWFTTVYLYDGAFWREITPHYINVRQALTDDIFTTNIKWVDNGQLYNTLVPSREVCGWTVRVFGDTIGGAGRLLFEGRIRDIGQVYTGEFKGQAERYIEAVGYGYSLQRNIYKKKISASDPRSQFETLAVEAVNAGLIKGYNIAPKIHVRQKPIDGNREYWDMFRQIAEESDWDFYVDNKGTLHAFPRGEYVYPNVIKYPDFDVFETQYNFDMSNVINTIQLWARATVQLGSDSEFTEALTNWSGPDLSLISGHVGDYAIQAYATGGEEVYLERTLNVDLSKGGMLHFYTSFLVERPLGKIPPEVKLEIKFYSTETDFYVNTISIPGGEYIKARRLRPSQYRTGWVEHYVGFNYFDPTGWTEENRPMWDNIMKLRVTLKSPRTNYTSRLAIDDLYIDSIYDVREKADITSINKYGKYEGKVSR